MLHFRLYRHGEIEVMKAVSTHIQIFYFLFIMVLPAIAENAPSKWPGVDEVVIEDLAKKAGRPAHEPFINVAQGDLLLFFFLVAGAVGGFIAGYAYRKLVSTSADGKKS